MGWYPTVIEDSLIKNLMKKKRFWNDLKKYLDGITKEHEELCKKHKVKNLWQIPDKVEYRFFPNNFDRNEGFDFDVEDLKGDAFCGDHMEHIARWLWDEDLWFLFEKHKINGSFVLHHEDGGGYYDGIIFEDGIPYDVDVEVKTVKGKKLEKEND